jgi:hypothetical protein
MLGYHCRLPVTWANVSDTNAFAHGGLLDLSTGSIQWSGQDSVHPRSFSWAAEKWVPVKWQWIAPDGLRYAYVNQAGLHVVDVNSGADRVVATLGGSVITWAGEGIYAWDATLPALRLLRFDPDTGKQVELYRGGASKTSGGPENVQWQLISGAYAWSVAGVRDSNGALTEFQLLRLDMFTAAVTVWLDDPGRSLALVGVDSGGRPFVTISTGHRYEVWSGSAPNQFLMIGDGSVLGIDGYSTTLTSGPTTWFTTRQNAATFYSDSTGFQVVARAVGGQDSSLPFLVPGGSCR